MKLLKLFAPLLGVFALATTSPAQCPTPDFLDGGPCCTATQPLFPVILGFGQRSFDICWKDCDVELVNDCYVRWSLAGTPANPCKTFTMKVRMYGGGALKWRGKMRMQYSRTWVESDATGALKQVWRYLANGDMRPTAAAGGPPCPVPPCAPAFARVKFTGYVDMAQDCATGNREYAWMLTHACDQIDHSPGFARGGAFHPDRSYTFVGPSAGFAVSPFTPIEMGSNIAEGVRRMPAVAGAPLTCEFEEPADFFIDPFQTFCLCGPVGALPQWMIGDFGLFGTCGTTVTTPGGPFLPGYLSMGIGSWTDPTVYPGVEELRWNVGGHDYDDPCTGITTQEVFYGVTTFGGNPAFQMLTTGVGPLLDRVFIDRSNALRSGATVMNVPYRSDHFMNLNLP